MIIMIHGRRSSPNQTAARRARLITPVGASRQEFFYGRLPPRDSTHPAFWPAPSGHIGVLISDHNVHYAFEIIDRGYVIDDGRVIVVGPPASLAASPLARSAFLGDDFRVPPLIGVNRAGR